jgi:hypothetical protein
MFADLGRDPADRLFRFQHLLDRNPFTQIQFSLGHIRSPCFPAR